MLNEKRLIIYKFLEISQKSLKNTIKTLHARTHKFTNKEEAKSGNPEIERF